MRGIVFHGEGRWALEARSMPSLASEDDVLLKIVSASIRGADKVLDPAAVDSTEAIQSATQRRGRRRH